MKKKVEAKRVLNERENIAKKLPQKCNEKKINKGISRHSVIYLGKQKYFLIG